MLIVKINSSAAVINCFSMLSSDISGDAQEFYYFCVCENAIAVTSSLNIECNFFHVN